SRSLKSFWLFAHPSKEFQARGPLVGSHRSGMSRAHLDLGKKGEEMAQAYLREKGYRLLERSYRCKLGEADLIMQDGDTIVFVEVKTRSSASFETPEQAVNARKQKKL